VLIYAATGRQDAPQKRERANELIGAGDFAVSTQVLQEFFWIATRKPAVPLTSSEALEWIDQLLDVGVVVVDPALIKVAILLSARYKISYWDAAIVAAAEALGATTLYSEDLNHGQSYGSVRVENPFRDL
jgi:predicted nucleic acid-binding protein